MPKIVLDDNPLWYKDAIIYQLHVKTFFDSNDDGIGDFRGLTQKLDYLVDLGITTIWLLPFYPSPLKDDGYDIADYLGINPDYGTLRDFREFLREAHRRGIRIITELVLNHTSDQHPWFQRARRSNAGSVSRDFYVWSTTPDRYKDARIIFIDFEPSNWSWDSIANAYYWHRFYYHQPDLNYDNPQVQKAMLRVLDFWFGMGVDGLRVDAVPYLFEREGTNCENLPETHSFLKELRAHVDQKFRNRIILGEANQWPEDAAAYFGQGDECHMAFHFPVMPRIFMALQMEDRFPIHDILAQTPHIPGTCQWAMFLRNHDELTLEMVTDEERDYMYKVYARDPKSRINLGIRRRLAPLINNNRRRIELMNFLLFSLPGTPIIYYGDEIGMGDNYYLGDRNGVRTPMQWSSDRNAGFSKANPQKLYLPIIIDPEYHYETINVENQTMNPSSLLWWMKRVIAKRKQHRSFGRGTMTFIQSNNPKVIAFTREHEGEIVLVVINLSRFAQVVELDITKYEGFTVYEVFSQNRFPLIKNVPYVLTLGFYDYLWFTLKKEEEVMRIGDFMWVIPQMKVDGTWEKVFYEKTRKKLENEVLPSYIPDCRWFSGKARTLQNIKIVDIIPVGRNIASGYFLFIEVSYIEGIPEMYLFPVSFCSGEKADRMIETKPFAIVARIKNESSEGVLCDATYDQEFRETLLWMIEKKRIFKGRYGDIIAFPGKQFRDLLRVSGKRLDSRVLNAEQSNTSLLYGDTFFLKLYRRLEEGMNPEAEIVRFLTEKAGFSHTPPYAGSVEYRRRDAEPVVIGLLQGFVPNQGDAWKFTLDSVSQYFEKVLSMSVDIREVPQSPRTFFDIRFADIPSKVRELIGCFYLEMTSLLGKRTGELHLALSSSHDDPLYAPEPYSMLYQRAVYQSMRNLTMKALQHARESMKKLPEAVEDEVVEILAQEQAILEGFRGLLEMKFSAARIRFHGDYHLGQVLFTGNNFVIIDFEGEPARPLTDRRLKKSPIRDIAGMIRSFHYATYGALLMRVSIRPEDIPMLEPWAEVLYRYISGIFLDSYLQAVRDAPFIPQEREQLKALLQCFLLEKAVYELDYELNNRPEWVIIPVRGIKHIVKHLLTREVV